MYKLSLSHHAVWGLYVADCLTQTMESIHTHRAGVRGGKQFDWTVDESVLMTRLRERLDKFRQDSLTYFTSVWARYDIDGDGELPRDECREMIKDCLVAQKNHLPLLIQGLAKEIIAAKRQKVVMTSDLSRFEDTFKSASATMDASLQRLHTQVEELLSLYTEVAEDAFVKTNSTNTDDVYASTSMFPASTSAAPPRFSEDGDVLVPQSEFVATLEHIDDELLGVTSLPRRIQATINPA